MKGAKTIKANDPKRSSKRRWSWPEIVRKSSQSTHDFKKALRTGQNFN